MEVDWTADRFRTYNLRLRALHATIARCPKCGAEPQRYCRAVTGDKIGPHPMRHTHAHLLMDIEDFERAWNTHGAVLSQLNPR